MATDLLSRRSLVAAWLRAGLEAVDPCMLTRDALDGGRGPATVVAIGKAAPAMCRGAAAALGWVDGLCVSDHEETVPPGVRLVIGDHPVPGERSLAAGELALATAARADLALVSGGGSALCELPRPGIELGYLAEVHRRLVESGAGIEEMNLVRAALSRIKCGGLGPLPTYVLSDVAGGGPELVASGPTVPVEIDPDAVLEILRRHRIEPHPLLHSILTELGPPGPPPPVLEVVGDGHTAAKAVVEVASTVTSSRLEETWVSGSIEEALPRFLASAGPGVTVAAGEATSPGGPGRGGRNTHAALIAATMIADGDAVFASFATDGVDGRSGGAGAIVDGGTLRRGGDPATALGEMDSASYLERSGDLLPGGPTGTNVADLWLMWRPVEGRDPILSV